MTEELSRLKGVELRDIWENEAQHFTPWLAEDENLILLGETLGIELELEAQEINIGDFKADILCINTEDSSRVLIENQLNETDHRHLGQILTYAAGLDVYTVIWIAKEFRDEHRAALDLQNEITNERFRYFGVEIKLWMIGNSIPAPQFVIVSKPNDSNLSISSISIDDWKTKFWTKFKEHLHTTNSGFRIYRPGPKNAVQFGIGHPDFRLEARLSKQIGRIGIRLYITGINAEVYFHLLYERREEIETEFEDNLEWEESPR